MLKLLRNQDFCSEKIAQKLLMKLHLEQKTKNLNFTQAKKFVLFICFLKAS